MRWSKFSLVVLISTLLTPVFAHASISSILSGAFDTIIKIGSLSFLGFPGGNDVTSFLRILIFILTFTIYFALITAANGFVKALTRNIAITISLILAIISTIFIPPAVLIASSAAFGTLISVLLLAAPILGMLAIIFLLPDLPCFWWLIKLLIACVLYWVSTQTSNYLADPAFSFSSNVATSLAGFWDWVLLIEFLIILYLLYKLLTCGGEETSIPLDPRQIVEKVKRIFNPNKPEPGRDDPNGEINLSPPPPPNKGAKPPRPNQGDDPTVPKDPILNDPKSKPIPGVPFYKPKNSKPPKEKRILVDLSPWFLSIRSQDNLGACAAFAGASMLEYVINRVSNYLNYDFKLSELFLWYNTRANKNSDTGTYPEELVNWIQREGVCKELLWSIEDHSSSKYLQEPLQNCYTDASMQRVLHVRNIPVDPDEWIRTLLDQHPINFSCNVNENFISLKQGFYEQLGGSQKGGHRMVIVGYDSHYQTPDGRKIEAFKIRNSWSTGWGENGYCWIPRNLLYQMISNRGSGLYVFTDWENKKPDKQLFTITGRAVFDDGHIGKVPSKWTGAEIVTSKKIKTPDDHAFKVAVMAQIKGDVRFLEGAETIVQPGQNGRFKIQFSADTTQFERLTHFSEFGQLHGVDFSKQAPGVVVVKKPEFEHNSDINNWFFHIAQFKYSHAGRGGEGHHAVMNPRSDIASKTKIHFSGRPIQFGPKHVTEDNVVIPVMRYTVQKTEPEVDDEKQKQKQKLALKRIHEKSVKEWKWAEEEHARLKKMEPAMLSNDIRSFTHLDAKVLQASRKIYGNYKSLKKILNHETKVLPLELADKLNNKLETLSVAQNNFVLFLQSPKPISTSENPKQKSIEAAKQFLLKNKGKKSAEVDQAWIDLGLSFRELLVWLAAIVTTLEDIVELTKEKK